MRVVVGVDEAGRGPLAGPVAVGVVAFYRTPRRVLFPGIRDSKQLSERRREYFFERMKALKKDGVLSWHVSFSPPRYIDRCGIVPAIERAMNRSIEALSLDPEHATILLDGALHAPETFIDQKTIVKGDETVLPITLAGIAAKVTRDREMERLSNRFPEYGFSQHKGYGTARHRSMLKRYGPCAVHRTSFGDLTK